MAGISCQELVELVTAYLEGDLDDDTRERFEEHLAVCPGCDDYVEQFRITIGELGEVPIATLSPDVQAGLLAQFRDWNR